MSGSKEAIVLGADLEGLAAAATLARAGRSVHVVDASSAPGGLSRALELHPGHVVPGLLHETALVRRDLLDSLGLSAERLAWRSTDTPLHVDAGGGSPILIERGRAGRGADADAYLRWRAFVDRLKSLIVDVLDDAPPEPAPGPMDLLRLAKKALKLRTLGEADMMELLRIATMPAWDWTAEWFEDDALRAGLVAPVLAGTVIGPRAAGTTALLLLREAARGVEPIGGLAAVVDALVACCEEADVTLHLGQPVASIDLGDGSGAAVEGVTLADGSTLRAPLVLSALDPRRTLVDLLPAGVLPHHVEHEAETWRRRGSTAVHLFALSSPPALPDATAQRICTATTPEQLERAADALKYGELPAAPWLDVRVWSTSDPRCAPEGAATLSVHVHGVAQGMEGDAHARLREQVLGALETLAPGFGAAVVADELLLPDDIEARYGIPGGHLYQGELALDQLWLQRPSLALSRYATPIPGLFLGGSGSHPGGPFAGGAGILAARAALRA